MNKLFVFGIGGTGARVMKSLIMLLAAGIKPSDYTIIPILIDPHKTLKELERCKLLLQLYNHLNKEIYKDISPKPESGFFHAEISTIAQLMPESELNQDFDIDSTNDQHFGVYIGYPNLPDDSPTRDLLDLLYAEKERNKPLSVGFKGNPHVGALVLNELMDSPAIKNFHRIFDPDDRIFIVGSIFGGTGAAGFPLLLKNFRESSKEAIKEAKIGALTVLPYFKLMDPEETGKKSDIDSDNFMIKTKSALSYYVKNLKNLNAHYYIGDFYHQSKAYVNDEDEQKNDAHLIELLGAVSIIHFANQALVKDDKHVFKYSLVRDADPVDYTSIADETARLTGSDLTSLLLFKYLHQNIKKSKKLPYYKTHDLQENVFNTTDFSVKLDDFFTNYFTPWLEELKENERECNLYNLEAKNDYNNLINGLEKTPYKSFIPYKRTHNISNLLLEFALNENQFKKLKDKNTFGHYCAICRKSINKVILRYYKNDNICHQEKKQQGI